MEQAHYLRACGPCKRRKSKCGKVKPCPSCIVYSTEDDCYTSGEQPLPPRINRGTSSSSIATASGVIIPRSRAPSITSLSSPSSVSLESEFYRQFQQQESASSARKGKGKESYKPALEGSDQVHTTIETSQGEKIDLIPVAPICECELAFYCFVTEIQWSVTTVDHRMRRVFRTFVHTGEATLLEQAYIYLVLAIVGKMASESFISIHAPTIRDAATQGRYTEAASTIMNLIPASFDSLPSNEVVLIGQIKLLQGQYFMTLNDVFSGLKHFKEAGRCASLARQSNDFTQDPSSDDTEAKYLKQSILRFSVEAAIADVWLSCMMNESPLQDLDNVTDYTPCPEEDPIDVAMVHQKLQAKTLAKSTRDLLVSPQYGSLEWATDLLTQDEEIEAFCNTLAASYPIAPTLINNIVSFKTQFTTNTTRLFFLAKRLHLLQTIASLNVPSSAESKILPVAGDLIKEMQRTLSLLQAPWRRIVGTVGNGAHVEQAMFVFANAVSETGLTSAEKVRERTTASTSASTSTSDAVIPPPPSPLIEFVTKFDSIYNMINTLGFIGKAGMLCAQMLKPVPIKRHPPLESQEELMAISSAIEREERGRQGGVGLEAEGDVEQPQDLSTLLAGWFGSEMDIETLEESLRSFNPP